MLYASTMVGPFTSPRIRVRGVDCVGALARAPLPPNHPALAETDRTIGYAEAPAPMIYTATITTASLRLRESRIVAELLLQGVSAAAWNDAILEQNVLQLGSPVSIHRVSRLASHHPDLRVLHLDLFDVVLDYLKARNLFDKTLRMQEEKGDAAVLKALKGPLAAEKIRDAIAAAHDPSHHDLVLLSGVGSMWPMMRVHGLLNCLHTVMGHTPLVLFYPGSFDGTTLKLFGRITAGTPSPHAKHHYRAFSLIPRGTRP